MAIPEWVTVVVLRGLRTDLAGFRDGMASSVGCWCSLLKTPSLGLRILSGTQGAWGWGPEIFRDPGAW